MSAFKVELAESRECGLKEFAVLDTHRREVARVVSGYGITADTAEYCASRLATMLSALQLSDSFKRRRA